MRSRRRITVRMIRRAEWMNLRWRKGYWMTQKKGTKGRMRVRV